MAALGALRSHLLKKCSTNLAFLSSFHRFLCTASSPPESGEFYDVVIVGGGMVGTSLACSLGAESLFGDQKILLLEGGPEKRIQTLSEKYSNRVSAITPGNQRFLDGIGVWEHIQNMRCKTFRRMHVTDACSAGHISFDANTDYDQVQEMGYIVENDVIVEALTRQLIKLKHNVDVLYKSRVTSVNFPWDASDAHSPSSQWVQVTLADGKQVSTRLLVGADGAQSFIRKSAGLQYDYIGWGYEQSGLVATLHLAEPTENHVAWQKFLPTGPIALLPLSEKHSSLVWSTTPTEAKTLQSLPPETFVDAVNNAFWEDLPRDPIVESANHFLHTLLSTVEPVKVSASSQSPPTVVDVEEGSRGVFPLGLGHSPYYVKPRLALVGDAAHRVHPLAGQGVNLGFGDVECLSRLLTTTAQHGQDLGHIDHLLEYETERQRNIVPMITTVDSLKRLFSTSATLPTLVRSLGLQLTNFMVPVKKQIVSFASK